MQGFLALLIELTGRKDLLQKTRPNSLRTRLVSVRGKKTTGEVELHPLQPVVSAAFECGRMEQGMSPMRICKAVCAVSFALICGTSVVGCSQEGSSAAIPEGAAALVGDVPVMEESVTAYIENFRATQGLSEEKDWGAWLVESGLTPESVRERAVHYYASQELLRLAAAENGVSIDPAEVEDRMQSLRASYDSDEAWHEALQQSGITEQEQYALMELMLLQEGVAARVIDHAEPTEDELLASVQLYASACDGAKRSSHILFAAGDEAAALETLSKIESGELSFPDAAQRLSLDASSAQRGGDVGWDKMNSFDQAYQDELNVLEPGQTSGLVTTQFGIHLIQCTDKLEAPDELTAIDQVSSGFVDTVRTMAGTTAKKQAFSTWMQEYEAKRGMQVGEMPANLPYDIDLAAYDVEATVLDDTSELSMPLASNETEGE